MGRLKRKSIISILLLFTLLFASACGSNQASVNKEEVTEETTEVKEMPPAGDESYLLANEEWPSIAEVYEEYFPIGVAIERILQR